jgi:hypothetical protein
MRFGINLFGGEVSYVQVLSGQIWLIVQSVSSSPRACSADASSCRQPLLAPRRRWRADIRTVELFSLLLFFFLSFLFFLHLQQQPPFPSPGRVQAVIIQWSL